jgi:hypothetical protein
MTICSSAMYCRSVTAVVRLLSGSLLKLILSAIDKCMLAEHRPKESASHDRERMGKHQCQVSTQIK